MSQHRRERISAGAINLFWLVLGFALVLAGFIITFLLVVGV